jgi:membrane protein YqaA with SNARE-associated domain
MPLLPFLVGSVIGRGARFFLVAGLVRLTGERGAERLRAWVDRIGWTVLLLAGFLLIGWMLAGGGSG